MSEDKFTPPPKSVPDKGELRGAVVAKDGKMVCDPSGAGRHEGEAEANERLMAAAPELYRLLKEAVDCIEYNFKGQDDVADFWIKEAKDALRIASGENR